MSKKLFTTYSTEEIADAFILTQKLTQKQQAEAAQQLTEARKKSQQEFSDSDRLLANLLQFKFKLENYLKNEDFNTDTKRTFYSI